MVRYVVVGGGVAGVCCAEELCRLCPNDSITLVALDRILKGISTVAKITRTIEELQVVEKSLDSLPYPNLHWIQGIATSIDPEHKRLFVQHTNTKTTTSTFTLPLEYDKLCICTGARPKRVLHNPHVMVLRDTDSVQALAHRLTDARHVAVVGNGGIALELAHALRGLDVTWVVRHGHIGDAFFDVDAAQFFLEELEQERKCDRGASAVTVVTVQAVPPKDGALQAEPQQQDKNENSTDDDVMGHAVGPAWTTSLPSGPSNDKGTFTIKRSVDVVAITSTNEKNVKEENDNFPFHVTLSDGSTLSTDVVISVIGVEPAVEWVPAQAERHPRDGGLVVNAAMETTMRGVFAAGDACTMTWAVTASPHWFQMRLWSQARAEGVYAAHCMAGVVEEVGSGMAFEVFTHVTRFLGKKVVMLGLYNGQRLEEEAEENVVSYSRIGGTAEERTFVRVVLVRGRVQGAILIGDTDLEETMENLILDGLDVSQYGPELLDPDIELDHIFD